MIACSVINKIIYNWENQSCQIEWYTMVSLYIWGNQNKHGQNHNDYAKQGKMINQYNQHVNVLNKHGNEAQKKSKSSIKIINLIINMSNISNKYINEAQRKITVSESPIKIIDQYNQSCQCPKWKLGNPQCAIKKWVSIDRFIKRHICFILSSSLTL